MAAERAVRRRRGVVSGSSRRGSARLSGVQRSRVLSSAVTVVSEVGYGQMTVARVAGGARVSRRTFYDLFEDREDCFLAIFDEAVTRASELMLAACANEHDGQERVRAGLTALLEYFDERPQIASLLVVDALQAGLRVQERRAEILERLAHGLHREGSKTPSGQQPPVLTGEGLIGAALGLIHTHVSARRQGPVLGLLNQLMAMIALAYRGPRAAQRELERPAPQSTRLSRARGQKAGAPVVSSFPASWSNPLAGLPMRVTDRTLLVMEVVGNRPGASNREIATAAGITDQGQISKLLTRLTRLGLVENTGLGHLSGEPNAWKLTLLGKRVTQQLDLCNPNA
jgi:AcrR family transcriptional regulator